MDARVNRLLSAAAAGTIALAALLIAAYFVDPFARADATALHGLRSLSEHHRWIWDLNDGLAHSVDLPYLLAGMVVLCAAGLLWGRRRQVVWATLVVAGANIVTQLVKVAAVHPRYQPILGAHQLTGPAFPSGHATAAMSLALAAILIAPSRWRPLTALAAGGFALAVSIAVIVQGWHFPSDVLGAFLVCGIVSMLVLAGQRWLELRRTGHSSARAPSSFTLPSAGILTALGTALGIGAALLVATHPSALTAYAAEHTTAVAATIGVALASAALIYSVLFEADRA